MSTEWIGRVLSKVEVQERLGRGNMAEVFLGKHQTLNRPVAVKILHSHLTQDDWLMSRFAAEAQAVAGLRHPHIVQVFDFDIVDDRPYIVMELLDGISLKQFLQDYRAETGHTLPEHVTARIVAAIASALSYAHSRGIVHRDVKPANVMLRKNDAIADVENIKASELEPILTDFGVAHMTDSTQKTASGAIIGTPSYMSPEQIQGVGVDGRSDIYGLGVMLFEMLTGELPYENDPDSSMMSVMLKHVQEPIPRLPKHLLHLQPIVDQAMAKKKEDRYQKATDLAAALYDALDIEGTRPGFGPEEDSLITSVLAKGPEGSGKSRPGTITAIEKTDASGTTRRGRWGIFGSVGVVVAIIIGILAANGVFSGGTGAEEPTEEEPSSAESEEEVAAVEEEDTPTPTLEPTAEPTEVPTETPVPSPTPNPPNGLVVFRDDAVVVTLDQLVPSSEEFAYEAWLESEVGDFVSLGLVTLEDDTATLADYRDPLAQILLTQYSGFVISEEPVPDSNSAFSGVRIYEGTIDTQELQDVRAMFKSSSILGQSLAFTLREGLKSQAAQYDRTLAFAIDAFATGVPFNAKTQGELLINLIVGESSDTFADYDGNGIAQTTGDNAGLEVYLRVLSAALDGAADLDPGQRPTVENLQEEIDDVLATIEQAREIAIQATETEDSEEIQALSQELEGLEVQQQINSLLDRSAELDLVISIDINEPQPEEE